MTALKPSIQPQQNILEDLGPLYHNYSFFNVNNQQISNKFVLNQKAKAPIITAYIAFALAKSRSRSSETVSFSELFCADGYYAMVASQLGCSPSIGVDNNKDGYFKKSLEISQRLGLKNIEFQVSDISLTPPLCNTDIVANIGGLYHMDDPESVLKMSLNLANKYLIVQSVVSLENSSPEYFEAPAPGWTWGNRYSIQSFDAMIKRNCPKIVDYHFNELEGNRRLQDRGSVYYLIEKGSTV